MDLPTLQDLIYFRYFKEWNKKIEEDDDIGAIKNLKQYNDALEKTLDDTQKELFNQFKWAVDCVNEYKVFQINENIMYIALKLGVQLQKVLELN